MIRYVLPIALVTLSGCVSLLSANTPRELYAILISDPIPESVTNIQADGSAWQSYEFYLRFKADEPVIDSILSTGYFAANCREVLSSSISISDLLIKYGKFMPPWRPENVRSPECYKLDPYNHKARHKDSEIIIDRQNKLVYFYAYGG